MTLYDDASIPRIEIAVTQAQRSEVLAYIEAQMRRRFACEPPPTRGVLFVSRDASGIVGTIALESSVNGAPFSVESWYAFEQHKAPFPFDRQRIVYGTRWLSSRQNVALPLFRGALAFAQSFGKEYMLFEAKPYVLDYFDRLSIAWKRFEQATLLPERACEVVGEDGMRYYRTEPLPTLCMLALDQFES